jgi:hypothetical protein
MLYSTGVPHASQNLLSLWTTIAHLLQRRSRWTGLPQYLQNLLEVEISSPQWPQGDVSGDRLCGVPHCLQNLAPVSRASPHWVQRRPSVALAPGPGPVAAGRAAALAVPVGIVG